MGARKTLSFWVIKSRKSIVIVLAIIGAGIAGSMAGFRYNGSTGAQQPSVTSEIILPDGGLLFKTKAGKIAAKLDVDEGGGFLTIYNASEKSAIVMGGSPYGGGGLIGVTNGRGAGAVLQLAGHEDGGSLVLLTRGKRGVELSTSNDGGSLSINGPTGDPAVVLTTSENQKQVSGKIDIYESIAGKLLWSAPGNGHRRAP